MDRPTKMPVPPEVPTLDKLRSVRGDAQRIGEFLEWLMEHYCDVEVCDLHRDNILHEYFEIDAKQAEKERTALLEHQRLINELCDNRQPPGRTTTADGVKIRPWLRVRVTTEGKECISNVERPAFQGQCVRVALGKGCQTFRLDGTVATVTSGNATGLFMPEELVSVPAGEG